MSWEPLLAFSILSYSVSVIFQRIFLRDQDTDPIAFCIILQLIPGAFIGIYALINGFQIPNLIPILPNLILMVILYGLANIFMANALKLSEASEFTIIFTSRALWTIGAAVLFLKESFSFQQSIGTLLILAGVVLVSLHRSKLTLGKGEIFSFLTAMTIGLAFVNDALILKSFETFSYLTFAFLVPAFFIWIFRPQVTPKIIKFLKGPRLLKFLGFQIIYTLSAVATYLAYKTGQNAAQIVTLSQISTILIVLLGIIFLKERGFLVRKLLGAALSFIGVVLVK